MALKRFFDWLMEREIDLGRKIDLTSRADWESGIAAAEVGRRLEVDLEDPVFREVYEEFVEDVVIKASIENTFLYSLFRKRWIGVSREN